MSNVLITGTSGFIGRQPAAFMLHTHRVPRIREELGFAPERDVRP